MLSHSLLSLGLLAACVLAAPTHLAKRKSRLDCVQFMYGGPFTSLGTNGWIHIFSNYTQYDENSESTTFNETRLGINTNGELSDCGACQSTQQFAFEVCQGPDRNGYDGYENSPEEFYGHILFSYDQADFQCLEAERNPVNGSSIRVATCLYDYHHAGSSNQYFQMSVTEDGVYEARLQPDEDDTYGVQVADDGTVLVYGEPNDGPWTFLGFKAPTY